MENREVARILRETAQLLEIDGAMIGRYRSYERAAELLDSLPESIEEVARDRDKLMELPGIGDGMADHIQEILKTGALFPANQTAQKISGNNSPSSGFAVARTKEGRVPLENLQGGNGRRGGKAGARRQAARFARLRRKERREYSEGDRGVSRNPPGASTSTWRRKKRKSSSRTFAPSANRSRPSRPQDRCGAARKPSATSTCWLRFPRENTLRNRWNRSAQHILEFPEIDQKLAHGENKVSFLLKNGLQVDVRILEKEVYGAALLYFTGSKEHNVALRGLANKMGYTLNEYALATLKGERPVARATEEEIYAKLGLDYIPPELRENTGEIDAAAEHRLPHLVELSDMRGDLQMHTTASDGKNSIEEMALAAKETRLRIYLADRSQQGGDGGQRP